MYAPPPSPLSIRSKTSPARTPGTTELIAASSFDTVTPGPGGPSFTPFLCAELEALAQAGQLFSVVELHRRLLAGIIKQRTNLLSKVWIHPSQSPVYVRLVGGVEVPSIGLLPRVREGSLVEKEDLEDNVPDESVTPEESWLEVPEIQGLKLSTVSPFKIRAPAASGASPRNYYWRSREQEEQKKLRLEQRAQRRREKLRTIARTPRRWRRDYFDIECRYYDYSNEGLIFAEGITAAIWWKWIEYLRNLSLRAPALEKKADL